MNKILLCTMLSASCVLQGSAQTSNPSAAQSALSSAAASSCSSSHESQSDSKQEKPIFSAWIRQTMGGGGRRYLTYHTRDGKAVSGTEDNWGGDFEFIEDNAPYKWNKINLTNVQERFRFLAHRRDWETKGYRVPDDRPLGGSILSYFSSILHEWAQQARTNSNDQAQSQTNNIAWLQQEIASKSVDGQSYKRLLISFTKSQELPNWKQVKIPGIDQESGQIHGLEITKEGDISLKDATNK